MELKQLEVIFGNRSVSIPYYELVGKKNGPSVFISGGIHGNEVNGVYMVKHILDWIREEKVEDKLVGRLLIFPILNSSGFKLRSRWVPEDKLDLNRQFGVEPPASLSQQIAYDLTHKLLRQCNMGIDFHDAGEGSLLVPHARIHKGDAHDCVSCSRSLARVFGTVFILERDGDIHMMAVALNNNYNVPVITVEVGGAQMLHPELKAFGMKGVKNVLSTYRMIEGQLELPKKQFFIANRVSVKAKRTSIIRFSAQLGDEIIQDDAIGELYCPYTQEVEEIKAAATGIVFSIWPNNLVLAGRTIYSILVTDTESGKMKGVEEIQNANL